MKIFDSLIPECRMLKGNIIVMTVLNNNIMAYKYRKCSQYESQVVKCVDRQTLLSSKVSFI